MDDVVGVISAYPMTDVPTFSRVTSSYSSLSDTDIGLIGFPHLINRAGYAVRVGLYTGVSNKGTSVFLIICKSLSQHPS